LKTHIGRLTWLFIFILLVVPGFAQSDSCRLRISLLTCSPGAELYSLFGHTAIRVTDSTAGTDLVFNYGTFDDTDPYFYVKFTRGLMRYALSVYPFSDFEWEYQAQNRSVIEQELQLSCAQKTALYEQLKINAQEDNRFYDYYFLEDNCTTRAMDMILQSAGAAVTTRNFLPAQTPTYRQMLHDYLDKGRQPWSKFGIDILLGSRLDQEVTLKEAMFLPDYLMTGFDSTFIAAEPLVLNKRTVLPNVPQPMANPWFTPWLFFTLLFLIVAVCTFAPSARIRKAMLRFDTIFFLLVGLLGWLLVILWIIRLDTVCRNNLNVLWALPSHFIIAFQLHKKRKWVRSYLRIVIAISTLLLAGWVLLPQRMNPGLIPVIGIILLRSFARLKQQIS